MAVPDSLVLRQSWHFFKHSTKHMTPLVLNQYHYLFFCKNTQVKSVLVFKLVTLVGTLLFPWQEAPFKGRGLSFLWFHSSRIISDLLYLKLLQRMP